MLIEFNLTHFRSFRETQTLSMAANNAIELQTQNTFNSGIAGLPRFLHSAVIYGPNAAGKSNLLIGLRFMKRFVLSSAKESQKGEKIKVTPFLFQQDSKTQPSEFEVLFIQYGVRYQYGFAVTDERVTHEWFRFEVQVFSVKKLEPRIEFFEKKLKPRMAYPEKRTQRWFEREYDFSSQQENWYFGSKLKGRRHIWKEATRSNALFLSTAIQLNSEQLKPVFDWFSEKLSLRKDRELNFSSTFHRAKTELGQKNILEFINAADLSIADLQIETRKLSMEELPNDMSQTVKEEFKEQFKGAEVTRVKMLHDVIGDNQKKVALSLQDESDGTQRLFELAGSWLDALDEGTVLGIDELELN